MTAHKIHMTTKFSNYDMIFNKFNSFYINNKTKNKKTTNGV